MLFCISSFKKRVRSIDGHRSMDCTSPLRSAVQSIDWTTSKVSLLGSDAPLLPEETIRLTIDLLFSFWSVVRSIDGLYFLIISIRQCCSQGWLPWWSQAWIAGAKGKSSFKKRSSIDRLNCIKSLSLRFWCTSPPWGNHKVNDRSSFLLLKCSTIDRANYFLSTAPLQLLLSCNQDRTRELDFFEGVVQSIDCTTRRILEGPRRRDPSTNFHFFSGTN